VKNATESDLYRVLIVSSLAEDSSGKVENIYGS
jgi:hypothetical protein